MPRKTGMWLKAILMALNIERAYNEAHKEHIEMGLSGGALHTLINGLGAIFPKDLIKRLKSIKDEKMRIRKAERE